MPMSDELNLRIDTQKPRNEEMKQVLQDFVDQVEPSMDKDRLELLENILSRSNVQFASVADKVNIDFRKFAHLLLTHDLTPLLSQVDTTSESTKIVVSSDLLADISNCERLIEEPDEEEVNVLSGIFVYGLLMGVVIALMVAIITQFVNMHISTRDLLLILAGFLGVLSLPLLLIVFEPSLKSMQKKHNEFFQRMVGFFSGKI